MSEFEEIGTEGRAPVRRVGGILALVVLAAVVVFSLGVMVGKRVTETVPRASEPPSALPLENLEALPTDAMGEGAEGVQREISESSEKGEKPLPSERLTFFETLPNDSARAPKALPKEPAKAVKPAEDPGISVARKPPPAAKPVKRSPGRPSSPGVSGLIGPGSFFVQISSTTNREWADDLVGRLKREGVEAKPTAVTLNGKQWYRIRVGSFPDREKALQAQGMLKKMGHDGMVVRGD